MIDYITEIDKIRKHYGYKAQHLCLKSGLGKEYIATLNAGKTVNPKLECLMAIARTLNEDRRKRFETFVELRLELGENIILDLMQSLERRAIYETLGNKY